MNESFNQWRDSPSVKEKDSFVLSDSDESDSVVQNSQSGRIFVIDSGDSTGTDLEDASPNKCKHKIEHSSTNEKEARRRVRKFLLSDSSNSSMDVDNVRDTEYAPSEEEMNDSDAERKYDINNSTDSNDNKPVIVDTTMDGEASSNSLESAPTPEPEIATSLAKQEVGVGNIDPIVAQKRALLVFNLEKLQNQLAKTKMLLSSGNIDMLPDKGEKLRQSMLLQEQEIKYITAELDKTPLISEPKREQLLVENKSDSSVEEVISHKLANEFNKVEPDFMHYPDDENGLSEKELGKRAQKTLNRELTLTVDRLQDLHGSLITRPSEDERADDPKGLKVKLMPHQQHALAWLLWREQQRPCGGVLADDMGLGKTLTMISLIIASLTKDSYSDTSSKEDSDEETFMGTKKRRLQKGGTLVVCPASLLAQWETEIKKRCRRGTLSVQIYHGSNRETVPARLAKHDVVITTYNILQREYQTKSTTYKINWSRVILDEAHIIRNHKSKCSEAACELIANKRWALTGTPIQNKELDLYAILKFLRCSPFDDIKVWKRWVDNKNAAGRQRLATVMKTLMLRRTKQELMETGALDNLPDKCIEEVSIKLDPQEQLVYEKVLIYSRTLFAQFLSQRAEKDHMVDLGLGTYDKPAFLSNPNKNTQFTKAQNKLLSLHADVKTHEILVLLLRLRQICCQPSLIHAMLDLDEMNENGITETENVDHNLSLQLNNVNLNKLENDDDEDDEEVGVNTEVVGNLLSSNNPVFDPNRVSSKIRAVLDMADEILQKKDKLIIVSQWTSMLDVIADQLSSMSGATFSKFTGSVPIKERQGIMDSFNADTDPKILLLSLTAGGVGLNLVGGNHLLLVDIHWNPQLETQAQDRIYRFGQKKNVFIYKFICKDTIEERIQRLQQSKLEIADHVLSGQRGSSASKLTLNDLKSLFGL